MIRLHSFWTPPLALFKSVPPEQKAIFGLPEQIPIG
jgi:hypothetical protein